MLPILRINNLSSKTTPTDLEILFKQVGTVESTKVITDHPNGESRWFGFVRMSSAEEAQNAINTLNGKMFQDRDLVVTRVKPNRRNRGRGQKGR
jgi:RNA recognition motif-containing protein